MVSYIGYKTKKLDVYISEFDADDDTNISSSFSSKLQLLDDEDIQDNENIIKASFQENIDFILELDALETDQIVVSASKKKEKVIDAPITIAAVSNQSIRRSISGDIGNVLKTVRGVEVYQAGLGRTAINVRGFMSAFNGRFVSLVDGANYMEPTFFIGYGKTFAWNILIFIIGTLIVGVLSYPYGKVYKAIHKKTNFDIYVEEKEKK